MKKLLLLTLSIFMVLTLLVACQNEPTPPDSTLSVTDTAIPTEPLDESVTKEPEDTATEAPTEQETTADTSPALDIDGFLEAVMENNRVDAIPHFCLDSNIKLDIAAGMDGMTTNMSMTGGVTMIQQSTQAMQVELRIPTQEPSVFLYVDGVLYVSSAEGKIRCTLLEEEMAQALSELFAGLFPDTSLSGEKGENSENDLMSGLTALFPAMKLSAFFARTDLTLDEATGDITATLTGMSPQAQLVINMLISSIEKNDMLDISDMDMSLLLDLFTTLDMDALSISMTTDKNYLLKSSTVVCGMDLTNAPDLVGDVPITITMRATTVLDRSVQTVTAPADVSSYTETDWRTLFGLQTAEMLGLVPNDDNIITLSESPDLFALQYDYIRKHPTDFKGITFSVVARGCDFEKQEDGSVNGTIYQVYEDGSAAYYPYVYISISQAVAGDMELPSDESVVKLTGALVLQDDGLYHLQIHTYEFISGPVAVG